MFWQQEPKSWKHAAILTAISTILFASIPIAIKGVSWGTLELKQAIIPAVAIKSLASAILMYSLIGINNFKWRLESGWQKLAVLSRACVNVGWVGSLLTDMPSGTVVLLFFSYPFFTMLFSWLNGTKLTSIDFISVALGTFGVAICVITELALGSALGTALVLGAALANGLFLFCADKIQPEDKASTFVMPEFACALLAPFAFTMNEFPSTSGWSCLLVSGLLTGSGMYILSKCMTKLKGHEAAQILLLQPLGTILIGILILHEPNSISVYIGGAMILSGCFLRFHFKK